MNNKEKIAMQLLEEKLHTATEALAIVSKRKDLTLPMRISQINGLIDRSDSVSAYCLQLLRDVEAGKLVIERIRSKESERKSLKHENKQLKKAKARLEEKCEYLENTIIRDTVLGE